MRRNRRPGYARRQALEAQFRDRPVLHFTATMRGLEDLRADETLVRQLQQANLHVTALSDSRPTIFRITRFPDIHIGFTHASEATFSWPRDGQSEQHASIFLVRSGAMRVNGFDDPDRQLPFAIFVPAGTSPINMEFPAPYTEMLFITFNSALIADIPLPDKIAYDIHVPELVLEPLYHSFRTINSTTIRESDAPAVRHATINMARALAKIIAFTPRQELTLFERSQAILQYEFGTPTLDTTTVASRLRVSRRALQSAYQSNDTSFLRELRKERVAAYRQARELTPLRRR